MGFWNEKATSYPIFESVSSAPSPTNFPTFMPPRTIHVVVLGFLTSVVLMFTLRDETI